MYCKETSNIADSFGQAYLLDGPDLRPHGGGLLRGDQEEVGQVLHGGREGARLVCGQFDVHIITSFVLISPAH